MAATRMAKVVWEGDLMKGKGRITAGSSGLFKDAAVTWASRTEGSDGRTSPEELLAAAHASCFSMALSNELAKNGTPAEKLEVQAQVTFDQSSLKVTKSALEVKAKVSGLDSATFQKIAVGAKNGCPVSGALKNNVDISLEASLL